MKKIMKFSALVLVFAAITGFARSQSADKVTRDLTDFTKVSFGVSGDLFISIGRNYSVILEGNKEVVENTITEVTGGKLIIKNDNWRNNRDERVKVFITIPELKGLGVSGSGRAEIRDAVVTDILSLSVSGSGKLFTGALESSKLECSISGSGDIIVSGGGDVLSADIAISGSGNYSGEKLKIKRAEISISGSGNCNCNISESLNARVSGSGDISYLGSPKIDARVSGSGKVRSR